MRDAGCGKREIGGHDARVRQRDLPRCETSPVTCHRQRRITHPASRIPHPGHTIAHGEPDGVARRNASRPLDGGDKGIEERRPREHDEPRPADQIRREVGEIGDSAVRDDRDRPAACGGRVERRGEPARALRRRKRVEPGDAPAEPPDDPSLGERPGRIESVPPATAVAHHAEGGVEQYERGCAAGLHARGGRVPHEQHQRAEGGGA